MIRAIVSRLVPIRQEQRRRLAALALFLLLAVGFVLRFFCLGADPSPSLENYFITDEGWWVHNARNFALFGQWVRDDFNQGFLYAPVHSLFMTLSFRAFGVGFASARAVSAAAGLLTVLFLYLAMRAAGEGRRAALLAAGFLATSNLFISVNRLAYPESLMICFAVLGWWCWLKGRYALAGAALGLSCFAKLAGVPGIALPVLLLGRRLYDELRSAGGLRQLGRAERLGPLRQTVIRPGLRYLSGLTGVSLLIAALIWLPNLRLLASTYAMTKYFNEPSSFWNILGNLAQFPADGFLAQIWPLAALTWLYLLARLGSPPGAAQRRAIPGPPEAGAGRYLAPFWLMINALAIAPLRFHPVHRYLVFMPALAWLAARGWEALPRLRWRAATRVVLGRAADWRLGIPLLVFWPFFHLLAALLAPALTRTGSPAFRAGSAAAYCFAFVWCVLLAILLLPLTGRILMRRQSPAAAAREPMARSRIRPFLLFGIAAVWCAVNLLPASRQASRPSWDLRRIAGRFAARSAGASVMGLTADTALLETRAFLFTPRIGILNQDPYARFHPTHVLALSAIDGRVLDRDAWFEEGAKLGEALRTARLLWTDWAVDGGRRRRKRFRLQLYAIEGE